MSAAAVITTALIAAPILLPHDAGVPALVDPVAITAEAVPVPALIQSIGPSTLNVHVMPAAVTVTPPPTRRRERPMPPPQARLTSRPMTTSAPLLVAVNTTGSRASKPLGKRIAGLFIGDGTYSVRPFPTVSTERQ
jgi:hypothetical protein